MTCTELGTAHRIEVHAPNGVAAIGLEQRLASLGPTAVCRHGRWVVELDGIHSVEAVEAEVTAWLAEIGAVVTTVFVDRQPLTVEAEPHGRHRATNASFSG